VQRSNFDNSINAAYYIAEWVDEVRGGKNTSPAAARRWPSQVRPAPEVKDPTGLPGLSSQTLPTVSARRPGLIRPAPRNIPTHRALVRGALDALSRLYETMHFATGYLYGLALPAQRYI
jgi:hypothetical protein